MSKCGATANGKHVLASYLQGGVWEVDGRTTIEIEVVCRWCDRRATISINNPTLDWE